MKVTSLICATLIFTASEIAAETRVETLCGTGHVNEATGQADVQSNPDGYYVRSLGVQIRHGDPRIVQAVGKMFHFCTRPAATPDMDATRAKLLQNERRLKYLFVPLECPDESIS